MAKESKDVAIQRIMQGLKCSKEEAEEVYAYDKAVDHDEKTSFDLPPDKAKVAQKMAHTGTRKKPMIPNLTKRERKPDELKRDIIQQLANFLQTTEFENIEVVNKERQITFQWGDEKFDLTLIKKRKPKD